MSLILTQEKLESLGITWPGLSSLQEHRHPPLQPLGRRQLRKQVFSRELANLAEHSSGCVRWDRLSTVSKSKVCAQGLRCSLRRQKSVQQLGLRMAWSSSVVTIRWLASKSSVQWAHAQYSTTKKATTDASCWLCCLSYASCFVLPQNPLFVLMECFASRRLTHLPLAPLLLAVRVFLVLALRLLPGLRRHPCLVVFRHHILGTPELHKCHENPQVDLEATSVHPSNQSYIFTTMALI